MESFTSWRVVRSSNLPTDLPMPNPDHATRLTRWFQQNQVPESHWQGLIDYNQPWFRNHIPTPLPEFPLPAHPCVESWRDYAHQAHQTSWTEVLQRLYPGFRFPIQADISNSIAYRNASRDDSYDCASALQLNAPDPIQFEAVQTAAGLLPALTVSDRQDFENMLRVLLHRNEPVPIPPSMGAALISGLPNRDRIERLRNTYFEDNPTARPGSWRREWETIRKQHKPQYQDRLLLLSVGPYSGIPAESAGFSSNQWLDISRIIRIHHEGAHAFCKQVFGVMHSNLLDELIADFAGLSTALGQFSSKVFLMGMGISPQGEMLAEGRMRNYLNQPELSKTLWPSQAKILCSAAQNLESWQKQPDVSIRLAKNDATALLSLAHTSLLELATGDFSISPFC